MVNQSLPFLFLLFFFHRFGVLHLHLAEGKRSQCIGQHGAEAEIDFRTLDEVGGIDLFGEGALATEAYVLGAMLAQADDFAILDGFGHYILQRHEHRVYVALVYGTSGLDSLRHLAEAHGATGLRLGIEFRWSTLF